jgi:hypothetical protein
MLCKNYFEWIFWCLMFFIPCVIIALAVLVQKKYTRDEKKHFSPS